MRMSIVAALGCLLLAPLARADVSLSADRKTLLIVSGIYEAASAINYYAFCTPLRSF